MTAQAALYIGKQLATSTIAAYLAANDGDVAPATALSIAAADEQTADTNGCGDLYRDLLIGVALMEGWT